jgi:hypothetical protein
MQVPVAVYIKLTFRGALSTIPLILFVRVLSNRHTTEISLGFAHDMQSLMSTEDNVASDTAWCMQLSMPRAHIVIDSYPNPNPIVGTKHLNHHHHHLHSSIVIHPMNISNIFLKLNISLWTN